MAYAAGFVLSFVAVSFARATSLDRDRAFYPTLMIIIASYYVLFAVMGGSTHALIVESIVMIAFLLIAVMGFKMNLWLVVVSLVAHGIFDLFHGLIVTNPGVPEWWPAFCLAFDLAAAALLAWLLTRLRVAVRPGPNRSAYPSLSRK